ncbi:unnamed protein product [Urochloa decumbens]|uniref:CCHC-type domain-containing protein n=1 Tax=Urochloa decumbens TaxID=240449 RepID=A0ABC9ENJ3_9POAL
MGDAARVLHGGDAEAKPPDPAATPPPPPLATLHPPTKPSACPRPAPHARSRLEARRKHGAPSGTGASSSRQGARFQEQLPIDFHTTALPGSIAPSPHPASFWVSPAFFDPRFNLHFVQNLVSFLLTAYPGRLCVSRVADYTFSVRVASANVANAIVVRGPLRLGDYVLLVHPSLDLALAAARAVTAARRERRWGRAVKANGNGRATDSFSNSAPDAVSAARQLRSAAATPPVRSNSHDARDAACSERLLQRAAPGAAPSALVPNRFFRDRAAAAAQAPCGSNVHPFPESHTCCPLGGREQLPPTRVTTPLNAPQPPATTGPYLKALLSPAHPPKTLRRRPAPILTTTGCFRCLASDHQVRDCRDPPRCRNCRRSGHRVRTCPMPVARMLTPWPRRQPTVPVPACRVAVQAVLFSPRSFPLPPRPTSPPPPSPAKIHTPSAFDPLAMLASSSSEAPDFELPRMPPPATTLAAGMAYPRASRSATHSPPVDIHVVDARGKRPAVPNRALSPRASPGRRSPPLAEPLMVAVPAAPPRAGSPAAPPSGAGSSVGVQAPAGHPDWASDSDDGYETVESGDLDSEFDDADYWEGRTDSLHVWLPAGNDRINDRLAFAYVTPPEAHPPPPPPANNFAPAAPPAGVAALPHAALLFHVAAALAGFLIANPVTAAVTVAAVEQDTPPAPPPSPASLASEAPQGSPSPPQNSPALKECDVRQDAPPAPPLSPTALGSDALHLPTPAPGRGRRPRSRALSTHVPPSQRQSTRLAEKASASFVHAADKASQRKALLNSLAPCSAALKGHVAKRGLLNRQKLPISVADLRKMVTTAGLGCSTADAVGVVPLRQE